MEGWSGEGESITPKLLMGAHTVILSFSSPLFFLSLIYLPAQIIYLLVKPMPELCGGRQRDKRLLETTNQNAGKQQTSTWFQGKNRTRPDGEITRRDSYWTIKAFIRDKRNICFGCPLVSVLIFFFYLLLFLCANRWAGLNREWCRSRPWPSSVETVFSHTITS